MPLSSLSSPARRLAALALLPLVGTAALVAAAPTAQAVDISSPVVISEVYGGGGNTGAPFTNDFIELYNKGDDGHRPVDGWSVQYASATNRRPGVDHHDQPHRLDRARRLLPDPGG